MRAFFHRLFRAGRATGAELESEIQFHIQTRVDELVQQGLTRREAEAQARREFGSRALSLEGSREAWNWRWLEEAWLDFRFALRSFLRTPIFTAAVVASLALADRRKYGGFHGVSRRTAGSASLSRRVAPGDGLGRRVGHRIPFEHAGARELRRLESAQLGVRRDGGDAQSLAEPDRAAAIPNGSRRKWRRTICSPCSACAHFSAAPIPPKRTSLEPRASP